MGNEHRPSTAEPPPDLGPLQWVVDHLLAIALWGSSGESAWPRTDDAALRELGQHWLDFAASLNEAVQGANVSANDISETFRGDAGLAFVTSWLQVGGTGDGSAYAVAASAYELGANAQNTAMMVEYTRLSMKLNILVTGSAIAFALAMSMFGGEAAVPGLLGTGRAYVMAAHQGLRTFVQNLATRAGLTAVTRLAPRSALGRLVVRGALQEAREELMIDVAAQAIQIHRGHRDGWNMDQIWMAGIAGGVAGAAGPVLFRGRYTGGFLTPTVRNRISDQFFHNPSIVRNTLESVLMGGEQGIILNALGSLTASTLVYGWNGPGGFLDALRSLRTADFLIGSALTSATYGGGQTFAHGVGTRLNPQQRVALGPDLELVFPRSGRYTADAAGLAVVVPRAGGDGVTPTYVSTPPPRLPASAGSPGAAGPTYPGTATAAPPASTAQVDGPVRTITAGDLPSLSDHARTAVRAALGSDGPLGNVGVAVVDAIDVASGGTVPPELRTATVETINRGVEYHRAATEVAVKLQETGVSWSKADVLLGGGEAAGAVRSLVDGMRPESILSELPAPRQAEIARDLQSLAERHAAWESSAAHLASLLTPEAPRLHAEPGPATAVRNAALWSAAGMADVAGRAGSGVHSTRITGWSPDPQAHIDVVDAEAARVAQVGNAAAALASLDLAGDIAREEARIRQDLTGLADRVTVRRSPGAVNEFRRRLRSGISWHFGWLGGGGGPVGHVVLRVRPEGGRRSVTVMIDIGGSAGSDPGLRVRPDGDRRWRVSVPLGASTQVVMSQVIDGLREILDTVDGRPHPEPGRPQAANETPSAPPPVREMPTAAGAGSVVAPESLVDGPATAATRSADDRDSAAADRPDAGETGSGETGPGETGPGENGPAEPPVELTAGDTGQHGGGGDSGGHAGTWARSPEPGGSGPGEQWLNLVGSAISSGPASEVRPTVAAMLDALAPLLSGEVRLVLDAGVHAAAQHARTLQAFVAFRASPPSRPEDVANQSTQDNATWVADPGHVSATDGPVVTAALDRLNTLADQLAGHAARLEGLLAAAPPADPEGAALAHAVLTRLEAGTDVDALLVPYRRALLGHGVDPGAIDAVVARALDAGRAAADNGPGEWSAEGVLEGAGVSDAAHLVPLTSTLIAAAEAMVTAGRTLEEHRRTRERWTGAGLAGPSLLPSESVDSRVSTVRVVGMTDISTDTATASPLRLRPDPAPGTTAGDQPGLVRALRDTMASDAREGADRRRTIQAGSLSAAYLSADLVAFADLIVDREVRARVAGLGPELERAINDRVAGRGRRARRWIGEIASVVGDLWSAAAADPSGELAALVGQLALDVAVWVDAEADAAAATEVALAGQDLHDPGGRQQQESSRYAADRARRRAELTHALLTDLAAGAEGPTGGREPIPGPRRPHGHGPDVAAPPPPGSDPSSTRKGAGNGGRGGAGRDGPDDGGRGGAGRDGSNGGDEGGGDAGPDGGEQPITRADVLAAASRIDVSDFMGGEVSRVRMEAGALHVDLVGGGRTEVFFFDIDLDGTAPRADRLQDLVHPRHVITLPGRARVDEIAPMLVAEIASALGRAPGPRLPDAVAQDRIDRWALPGHSAPQASLESALGAQREAVARAEHAFAAAERTDRRIDAFASRAASLLARTESARQALLDALPRHDAVGADDTVADAVRALRLATSDLRAAIDDLTSAAAMFEAEQQLHAFFGTDPGALASRLSTDQLAARVEPGTWRVRFEGRTGDEPPFMLVIQTGTDLGEPVRAPTNAERAAPAPPVFLVRVPHRTAGDPDQVLDLLVQARRTAYGELSREREGRAPTGPAVAGNELDPRAVTDAEWRRVVDGTRAREAERHAQVRGRLAEAGVLPDQDGHARRRAGLAAWLVAPEDPMATPARRWRLRRPPAPDATAAAARELLARRMLDTRADRSSPLVLAAVGAAARSLATLPGGPAPAARLSIEPTALATRGHNPDTVLAARLTVSVDPLAGQPLELAVRLADPSVFDLDRSQAVRLVGDGPGAWHLEVRRDASDAAIRIGLAGALAELRVVTATRPASARIRARIEAQIAAIRRERAIADDVAGVGLEYLLGDLHRLSKQDKGLAERVWPALAETIDQVRRYGDGMTRAQRRERYEAWTGQPYRDELSLPQPGLGTRGDPDRRGLRPGPNWPGQVRLGEADRRELRDVEDLVVRIEADSDPAALTERLLAYLGDLGLLGTDPETGVRWRAATAHLPREVTARLEELRTRPVPLESVPDGLLAALRRLALTGAIGAGQRMIEFDRLGPVLRLRLTTGSAQAVVDVRLGFLPPGRARFTPASADQAHGLELAPDLLDNPDPLAVALGTLLRLTEATNATFPHGQTTLAPDHSIPDALRNEAPPEPRPSWLEQLRDQLQATEPDAVEFLEFLHDEGALPTAEALDASAVGGASSADVIARMWQAEWRRSERAGQWLATLDPLLDALGVPPDRFVPTPRRSPNDAGWRELARVLDEKVPFVDVPDSGDADQLAAATIAVVVAELEAAGAAGDIATYAQPLRLARRLVNESAAARLAAGEPILAPAAQGGNARALDERVREDVVGGLRSAGLLGPASYPLDVLRPGDRAERALTEVAQALQSVTAGRMPPATERLAAAFEDLAARTEQAVGALEARRAHRAKLADAADNEAKQIEESSTRRLKADLWRRPDADDAAVRTRRSVAELHRSHAEHYRLAADAARRARGRDRALADALAELSSSTAAPGPGRRPDPVMVDQARARLAEAEAAHEEYHTHLARTRPPESAFSMGVVSGPLPGVDALGAAISAKLDAYGIDHGPSLDGWPSSTGVTEGSRSPGAPGQQMKAEFRELAGDGLILRSGRAEVRVRPVFGGEPVEDPDWPNDSSEIIVGQLPQRRTAPLELLASLAQRVGVAASAPVNWLAGAAPTAVGMPVSIPRWLDGSVGAERVRRTSQTGGGSGHAQIGNILDVRGNARMWDIPVVGYTVSVRTPDTVRAAGRHGDGWVDPTTVALGPEGGSIRLWVPTTSTGPAPTPTGFERAPATGVEQFPEGVAVTLNGLRAATDIARDLADAPVGSLTAQDIEAQFMVHQSLFASAVNGGLAQDIVGEDGRRTGILFSRIDLDRNPDGTVAATPIHVSKRVLWTEALRLAFHPVRSSIDVARSLALRAALGLRLTNFAAAVGLSRTGASNSALGADNTGIGVGVHRRVGDHLVYQIPYQQTIQYVPFTGAAAQPRVVGGVAQIVLSARDAWDYGLPVPSELLRDGPNGGRTPRDAPDPARRPTGRQAVPPTFTRRGHAAGPGQVEKLTGIEDIADGLRSLLVEANLHPRIVAGLPVWEEDADPELLAQQVNNWNTLDQLVATGAESLYNQAVMTGVPVTVTGLAGHVLPRLRIGVPRGRGLTGDVLVVLEPDFDKADYLGLTDAAQKVNLPISSGAAVRTQGASRTVGVTPIDVAWTGAADGGAQVTQAGASARVSSTRTASASEGFVLNEVGLDEHGGPMAVFRVPHTVRLVWADDGRPVTGTDGRPIEARGAADLAWTVDMLPAQEPHFSPPVVGPPETTARQVLRDAYVISVSGGEPGELLAAGRAVAPDASRPGAPGFANLVSLLSPVNLLANARAMLRGATWGSEHVIGTDSRGSVRISISRLGQSRFAGPVKDFVLGRIRFAMLPEGMSLGGTRGLGGDASGAGGVSDAAAGAPTEAPALGSGTATVGNARFWNRWRRQGWISGQESLLIDVGDAFLFEVDGEFNLTGTQDGEAGSPSRTVNGDVLYAIPVRHAVGHYARGRLPLPLDQVAALVASYATAHRDLPRRDVLALLEQYGTDYRLARQADPRITRRHPNLPTDDFVTPDGLQEKLALRLREQFPDVVVEPDTESTAVIARIMAASTALPAVTPATPSRLPEYLARGGLTDFEQMEVVDIRSTSGGAPVPVAIDPAAPPQLLHVVLDQVAQVAPGALDATGAAALFNLLEGERWLGFADIMRRDDGWQIPGNGFTVRLRLVDENVTENLGPTRDAILIKQLYRYRETAAGAGTGGVRSVGVDGAVATPWGGTGQGSLASSPSHGSTAGILDQHTQMSRVASFAGLDRLAWRGAVVVEATREGPLTFDAVRRRGASARSSAEITLAGVRVVPAGLLEPDQARRAMEPAIDPRPMPPVPGPVVVERADADAIRDAIEAGLVEMTGSSELGRSIVDANTDRLDRLGDPVRSASLPGELDGPDHLTTLDVPRRARSIGRIRGRTYVDVAVEAVITGTGSVTRWPAPGELGEIDRRMRQTTHGTSHTATHPLSYALGGDADRGPGARVLGGAASGVSAGRTAGSRNETTNSEFGPVVSVDAAVSHRVTLRAYRVDRHGRARDVVEQQVFTSVASARLTMFASAHARMLADAGMPGAGHPHAPDPAAAVAAARDALRDRRLPSYSFAAQIDAARRNPDSVPGRYYETVASTISGDPNLGPDATVHIVVDPAPADDRDPDPITYARLLSLVMNRQVVLEILQSGQHGRARVVLTAVRGDLFAVDGIDPGFLDELRVLPSEVLARMRLAELGRLYADAQSRGISLVDAVRPGPPQLPAGAKPNPSLTVLGDPANHTPPADGRAWTAQELRARLRVLRNDSGGRTVWLATDTDFADTDLRALVARAAVPKEYVGLVAPGRDGRVWLEDRWVDPPALADALHRTLGGPRPYFLVVPQTLAGVDPFAASFFQANGEQPVIASADHVLIDRFRGTVVAATPWFAATGAVGQFVQVYRLQRDPAGVATIDVVPVGGVWPPAAAAAHGDYVCLVPVPTTPHGDAGGQHPGQARTVDPPVAITGGGP